MHCKRAGAPQSVALHEQVQDPAKGRVMMDEALDFRGNLYFGAVAACCVGCACWQRNFNLLQRWALILVCISLVGTYTPWAFGQSLANLHSFGGAARPPGKLSHCRGRALAVHVPI